MTLRLLLVWLALPGLDLAQVGPVRRDAQAQVLLAPVESAAFADLRAADNERVAAIIAADPTRLEEVLSDELHYAHSNGLIDTKASFIESLTSRRAVCRSVEYLSHKFIPAGPGVVLMTGRALVRVATAEGERLLDLNFLAVWRQENGRWRFLAWQSNRVPSPAPAR